MKQDKSGSYGLIVKVEFEEESFQLMPEKIKQGFEIDHKYTVHTVYVTKYIYSYTFT